MSSFYNARTDIKLPKFTYRKTIVETAMRYLLLIAALYTNNFLAGELLKQKFTYEIKRKKNNITETVKISATKIIKKLIETPTRETLISLASHRINTSTTLHVKNTERTPKMYQDYFCTPLHLAVEHGDPLILNLLLLLSCKVNALDSCGRTPLHLAVLTRHIENVKILLANGADGHAKDEDKNTPYCFAKKIDNKEAMELLTEDTLKETPYFLTQKMAYKKAKDLIAIEDEKYHTSAL